MAGSPIKRARKNAARDAVERGERVIPFPHLTHPRAGLSHGAWRALSPAEKIERLFGMSLDDIHAIICPPLDELDPHQRHLRWQVSLTVFKVCYKAVFDGKLGRDAASARDRKHVLGELAREFAARASR